jgi:hypothetical protein
MGLKGDQINENVIKMWKFIKNTGLRKFQILSMHSSVFLYETGREIGATVLKACILSNAQHKTVKSMLYGYVGESRMLGNQRLDNQGSTVS